MDIQVKRLDRAYLTSEEIDRKTVEVSNKLSSDLVRILNNIKAHWHGDDATLHINALIDQYNKLYKYFKEMNKTSSFLQNYFVTLQVCRSKTTSNNRIGEKVSPKCEFLPVAKLETTGEYFYNPQLVGDCADLNEVCNYYDQYINSIDVSVKEVLANWTIGTGRQEVGKNYQRIFDYAQKMSKELHSLKDTLEIVNQNIGKVSNS